MHREAQAVGLKRAWFQKPPKASWPHYDCAPRVRARLVARGAIQTDQFGPAEFEARRKGDAATLARIANSRALRATAKITLARVVAPPPPPRAQGEGRSAA